MKDIVVVLPGITGSILQKDGKDLWAISGQSLWEALTRESGIAESLMLQGDDPDQEDLGDGIVATGLMQDFTLIPGLWKIDGYSGIRDLVTTYFDVIIGENESAKPANYYEFAYDWRRDNRFAAKQLHRFLNERLKVWRDYTGYKEAKAILIAHSMGGIVARYCLEVLGARKDCRALISFGTPFRGSPQSLEYLANGYKNLFLDLTSAVRTFTSVYQLLPIYETVKVGSDYFRIAEAPIIEGVDHSKAEAALGFHREIEAAVATWSRSHTREEDGLLMVPFVGTGQPTLQSAELIGKALSTKRAVPEWIDPLLDNGDGTVPYASAIPIEMSNRPDWRCFPERHSALQNHGRALAELRNLLTQTQIRPLGAVRMLEQEKAAQPDAPALYVDLEDIYLQGEPVLITAKVLYPMEKSSGIIAMLEKVDEPGAPRRINLFKRDEDVWAVEIPNLGPGPYRVEVRTRESGPLAPDPVHDLFAITP